MASGLILRLQAQFIPLKMYGFERVDRERERAIVERLTGGPSARRARPASAAAAASAAASAAAIAADSSAVCERYRTALNSPEPSDLEAGGRPAVAPEEYFQQLYRRLGRSHTFSSRCKQRAIDPHRMCCGPPGEAPDYQPIRELNLEALRPASPPAQEKPQQQPQQQQQQLQRQLPSFAALVGFTRIASRTLGEHRTGERQTEGDKQSGPTAAPITMFGALGRLRHHAKQEELQLREREQQAREIRSDWEIVNATEFVRNYERENRRDMKLAVLARPTVASRFKTAGALTGGCPLCREMPELAADWQRRLQVTAGGGGGGGGGGGDEEDAGSAECPRCGRFHGLRGRRASAAGESEREAEETAEAEGGPTAAVADGYEWGQAEEAALVERLRAPTRASEGGVPFCQKGRRAVGPGLGAALLGFEGQRPKSALERVRSAQKRKELIDAMTVRLHSGGGGGGDGKGGNAVSGGGGGYRSGRVALGGTFNHRH